MLVGIAKQSVNMANISASDLARQQIALPPLASQKAYAGVVAGIERLGASFAKSQHESEALFASLLHRAFRGELTAPTPKSTTPHKKQLSFLE